MGVEGCGRCRSLWVVVEGCGRACMAVEGCARAWKGVEGRAWMWKAVEGCGRAWKTHLPSGGLDILHEASPASSSSTRPLGGMVVLSLPKACLTTRRLPPGETGVATGAKRERVVSPLKPGARAAKRMREGQWRGLVGSSDGSTRRTCSARKASAKASEREGR